MISGVPFKTQVEIAVIMGSLNTDRNGWALAFDGCGFGFLAGYHLFTHGRGFLVVAGDTAIPANGQWTRTAMVLAGQNPLHGGLARIEDCDFT